MNTRTLSVHESSPFGSVPPTFPIAPWFVAAGLVLLRGGAWALTNRYTPTVLAATHLVTIGFPMTAIAGTVGLSLAFMLKRLWSRGCCWHDAMTYFRSIALTSLIAVYSSAALLALGYARPPRKPLVFGVLVFFGAAASFTDGTPYKIVLFLIWLDLQRQRRRTALLKQGVMSGCRVVIDFVVRLRALVTVLIAIFRRPAAPLAAVFWVGAGASLDLNVALATLSCRRVLRPLSSA